MPIYGFESQDDFNRARDVIRTVEGKRVDLTRTKRARYPGVGSGGSGARPYILTQTDGTAEEGNIAVYRYCGLTDLTAKLASPVTPFVPNGLFTPTGDDVSLNVQLMSGVAFTGQIVMAQPVGSAKLIVGGWSNSFFRGESVEAINDAAEGLVDLQYVDYEGMSLTARVTARNSIGRGIESGMVVYVWYGSDSEGERFYIQSVECSVT